MNFDWYGFHGNNSINEIKAKSFDCFSKIKLLGIHGSSDDAKKLHKELVYGLRNPKKKEIEIAPKYPELITDNLSILYKLDLKIPKIINLNPYPKYSFFLQFTFTLATPYLSKDDDQFYSCENPVKKDKVFKVPIISGSSWKGNMRWTAGKDIELKTEKLNKKLLKRIQLVKLFGNENEAEERYFNFLLSQEMVDKFKKEIQYWTNNGGLRRGRLNFYPTFFNQIGLEVINPHDRKTKAGTQPIYIESVPEGADGTFSLLYMPFDLMGRPETVVKDEVKKDLETISPAIKKMMLTYGFSAKKSSGFGIVQNRLSDIYCKMNGIPNAQIKKELPKQKSKDIRSNNLKDIKQMVAQAEKANQNTFDDLEKQIKAIISELLR